MTENLVVQLRDPPPGEEAVLALLQEAAIALEARNKALERIGAICETYNDGRTHWVGCESQHPVCQIERLASEATKA